MTPRLLLLLAAVAALLGLLFAGLGMNARELPSPLVGKPAPPFELESLFDAELTLTEQDFIGEVALVNVWATWCSTCRAEKPLLLELARGGIPLYGINYRDERDEALRTRLLKMVGGHLGRRYAGKLIPFVASPIMAIQNGNAVAELGERALRFYGGA